MPPTTLYFSKELSLQTAFIQWIGSRNSSFGLSGHAVSIDAVRSADTAHLCTKLEVLYRLRGDLDKTAVENAIQLSEEKYCSVSATLRKTANLTWRYELLPGSANL